MLVKHLEITVRVQFQTLMRQVSLFGMCLQKQKRHVNKNRVSLGRLSKGINLKNWGQVLSAITSKWTHNRAQRLKPRAVESGGPGATSVTHSLLVMRLGAVNYTSPSLSFIIFKVKIRELPHFILVGLSGTKPVHSRAQCQVHSVFPQK